MLVFLIVFHFLTLDLRYFSVDVHWDRVVGGKDDLDLLVFGFVGILLNELAFPKRILSHLNRGLCWGLCLSVFIVFGLVLVTGELLFGFV